MLSILDHELRAEYELYQQRTSPICPAEFTPPEQLRIDTVTALGDIYPSIDNLDSLAILLNTDVDFDQEVNLRLKKEGVYLVDDQSILDNTIISVSYSKTQTMKGIDLRPGGRKWPHSVNVHMMYSHRNISIKVSRNTIQFCGSRSEEDAEAIIEIITNRINQAFADYQTLRQLEWGRLLPAIRSAKERFADSSERIEYLVSTLPEYIEDVEVLDAILRLTVRCTSTAQIERALRKVANLKMPEEQMVIEHDQLHIVMMKRTFHIPYQFLFRDFDAYLKTIPGLRRTTSFNPDIISRIYLWIPHFDEEGNWRQMETLTLTSTMTVNHNSYSSKMMNETYARFMGLVLDFINHHAPRYWVLPR